MAEKNTLSILETIKKKMHKLDQKSEKTVAPTNSNEEFQYISSALKVEAAAVSEIKVSEQKIDITMSKFEDDLNLEDLETEAVPPTSNIPPVAKAIENKQSEALDDFNLDDFDLDSEAKIPATDSPTEKAKQNEVDDFNEDEIEDFEDEIDIAEDEVVEQEIEEESEGEALGDFDWLGNKIINDEIKEIPAVVAPKVDDLDLTFDEETHEAENAEEDVLDLENHEEEPSPKELVEDDDLDFDDLEKHEEKPPAMEIKKESYEDDDLNFDDLENLSPKKLEPQIHKDLDDDLDLELKLADKKPEALKAKTPPVMASKNPIDFFDLEMKEKSISQTVLKTSSNDEIDLEFEKEIMGLKPASLPEKLVEDFISNPAPLQPQAAQQNYDSQSQVSVVNASKGANNNMGNGIYDSTLRQVGDSLRKLVDAKNVVSGISTFSQGPAFVELATHLMEPKLEKWLNEHLPDLVEKIVREEIKKIIPKD
jgi:cell pole-organizing protein PopZ